MEMGVRGSGTTVELKHRHHPDADAQLPAPLLDQLLHRPGAGVHEGFHKHRVGDDKRTRTGRDRQNNPAMRHAVEENAAYLLQPVVDGGFEAARTQPALASETHFMVFAASLA